MWLPICVEGLAWSKIGLSGGSSGEIIGKEVGKEGLGCDVLKADEPDVEKRYGALAPFMRGMRRKTRNAYCHADVTQCASCPRKVFPDNNILFVLLLHKTLLRTAHVSNIQPDFLNHK